MTQATELLQELHGTVVLADKGYDSQILVDTLKSQGCLAIIPSRKNAKNPRELNKELYKERFLVEAFFSKIKHFRRVFSRFDKTTTVFPDFYIWLEHLYGCAKNWFTEPSARSLIRSLKMELSSGDLKQRIHYLRKNTLYSLHNFELIL